MELEPSVERALKQAGAAALTFNAPLGRPRADHIAGFLARAGGSVVDLGCGAGALATLIAERSPGTQVLGLDLDPTLIMRAKRAAGLQDCLRFEVADVTTWPGVADAAVCIGASHAFGGSAAMFRWLSERVGAAVVGDGIWWRDPDPENLERLGPMPRGVDALAALAEAEGWRVEHRDVSTLEEWDEFELGWIGGVRAVGSEEAHAFAAMRSAQYQRYRGVLGFGWLYLGR
ncbi:MAG: class I SAM-dependent methyltransferase [Deltaproteobacteria bacterium]|nr:class I SAM-dependent methyltransferase [Deltaproteobacteria bacterium]